MEMRGNQWNFFISWGSMMLKSHGIIHCFYVIFSDSIVSSGSLCLLSHAHFFFFGKFASGLRL